MRAGVILTVLLCVPGISADSTNEELVNTYDNYINVSLDLDRSDRSLLSQWTDEYQLKQVNITAQYRLMMTRYKDRSLGRLIDNTKWNQCIKVYRNEIKKDENWYYENESECLKVANTAEQAEMKANDQLGKEIKRWRKGYKYLKNLCESEHLSNDAAYIECVVEYVQKDKYDEVYQRLILLKLDAMRSIFLKHHQGLFNLEKCLNTTLSVYLDKIRTLKGVIDRCYYGNKT